ncbi:hypothetical protein Val02_71800 [Virgisporangium aliadipatigenens]|uniref:Anti-sigma factor antagonist n=1 Tax=Virgisporangium aliadipatigenens TaxID=741659 RepID=A0A8J3YRF2_9ACTN|nr:STAS domain-containing protein [Virgisporangium aliadipatigenens]GIJ50294.1 hypothetical protein Val02_71800 [Virgisporangium aliadipatigenens]
MELTTRVSGPLTVVTVHEDADLATAADLRTYLYDALEGGATHLVVDLSATTFVDSAVLNALIAVHRRATTAGGRFGVLCPDERIRRPFEVTGLHEVFEMYSSLAQASGPPP